MSTLVEHAERELALCGQTAEDPAYAQSIVDAIRAFTSFGHSGGSAMVAIDQLTNLLNHRALSPLTSDPDEWEDRSEQSGQPFWQNRRDSRAFSEDAGKTWKIINDEEAPGAGPLAELIGNATSGDLILLRARDLRDAEHLHEQLTDFKAEHPDIDVLVLAPALQTHVVPAAERTGDDAYAAHRAEIEQVLRAGAPLIDMDLGISPTSRLIGVGLSDAVDVLARHTWPTYVASVGAHALLEDAEERLRAAGLKPVGEDETAGEHHA